MRFGLIAKDIHNSVLPHTFAAYAKELGIELDFDIFNVEEKEFQNLIEYCRRHLDGFIVTMPYKCTILEYADDIDISAKQCGSSNCCKIRQGKLTAYNTDGWGFIKDMQLKGIDVQGKRIVMVGAGGVAMSLAYHFKINGVERVDVFNVFEEQLYNLCNKFGERFVPHLFSYSGIEEVIGEADIFINASILGQVGYAEYEDLRFLEFMKKDAVVYDVNYSKPDALLPKCSKMLGLKSYVGCAMSALQGIRAMEIWTGKTPSDLCAAKLVEDLENASM